MVDANENLTNTSPTYTDDHHRLSQDYWKENYNKTPYYKDALTHYPDLDYDRDYSGAYNLGYSSRRENEGRNFDEMEGSLKQKWEDTKHESRLKWEQAKHAIKDAWDRM